MKQRYYLLLILNFIFCGYSYSQFENHSVKVDTSHFNYAYWNGVADKQHLTTEERTELLTKQKKDYIEEQTHVHYADSEYVWTPNENYKGYNSSNTNTFGQPCANIDFENGLTSWTVTNGTNPASGG